MLASLEGFWSGIPPQQLRITKFYITFVGHHHACRLESSLMEHGILIQCWVNFGRQSSTLAQHWRSIGSMYGVCRSGSVCWWHFLLQQSPRHSRAVPNKDMWPSRLCPACIVGQGCDVCQQRAGTCTHTGHTTGMCTHTCTADDRSDEMWDGGLNTV